MFRVRFGDCCTGFTNVATRFCAFLLLDPEQDDDDDDDDVAAFVGDGDDDDAESEEVLDFIGKPLRALLVSDVLPPA